MWRTAACDVCLVLWWFFVELVLPLVLLTIAGCLIMSIVWAVAQGIEALVVG